MQVFDLSDVKANIFAHVEQSYIEPSFVDTINANGLNIKTGITNRIEEHVMSQLFNNETTITEFENWSTNIFKRHNLIYSNIINLEFAFTDKTIDNRFVRYAGFYVKDNTVTASELGAFSNSGALRLLGRQNDTIKWVDGHVLSTYDNIEFSQYANSFGINAKELVEFNFVLNPSHGQLLQVLFNDTAEHTIIFSSATVGSTIEATKQLIVNSINNQYQGAHTTIHASEVNGAIRLESNMLQSTGLLRLVVPAGFSIKQPLFSLEQYNGEFIGGTNASISMNTYIKPTAFAKCMYMSSTGSQIIDTIRRVYEYKGDYLYELSQPIVKAKTPSNVWFVRTLQEKPILCSILEHKELDMYAGVSQYTDPLDFDTEAYRTYLLNTIAAPDFIGSALAFYDVPTISALPDQSLSEYRAKLTQIVNQFFDSIDVNHSYLLDTIDMSSLEATTVANEYDRLRESTNSELSKTNRLYQFVNKWSSALGTDTYNNDYRFNCALPFRFDNFSSAVKGVNRDLRYHSHSWFIIGEGKPPYYDVTESNIKRLMSYTKYPIDVNDLASTTSDAYDNLSWSTDSNAYSAWSMIYYDAEQKICYTFFKGIMYRFESPELAGYRFSVILKSSELLVDDVFNMVLIKNDTFKTLSLCIRFYIPDPVLTSLERGPNWYYLDRSLLYFSNTIYSTINNAIDFGTDRISLSLYNTTVQKYYLGQPVTTNWYHTTTDGDILHVGRGDSSIFNVNFNDILLVGDSLEIHYDDSTNVISNIVQDPNSPFYGMNIRFEDIVEVTQHYFWCRRILISSNTTYDPDGVDDTNISDNIVNLPTPISINVYAEFILNSHIFYENNIIYMSKSIARFNCIYNKIVNTSANNARYKEISLANIKIALSYAPLAIENSNNQFLSVFITDPTEFSILVKYTATDSALVQLPTQYIYPMSRYSTQYVPATKVLSKYYDSGAYKNVYPANRSWSNEYKAYVSRTVTSQQLGSVTEAYSDIPHTISDSSLYEYIRSTVNGQISTVQLPWIANPAEYRNITSLVFNSDEKIVVTTVLSQQLDMLELLRSRISDWIQLNDYITDSTRLQLAFLEYDVSEQTQNNINIDDAIMTAFLTNTFLRIYRIESIVTNTGQIVQFNMTNTIINAVIESDTQLGSEVTITYTR